MHVQRKISGKTKFSGYQQLGTKVFDKQVHKFKHFFSLTSFVIFVLEKWESLGQF